MSKAHIVIIGGGIIGSAIATFLARADQAGSITVIEPDPEYKLAATPVGAGGVRQLFSQPENIWMSQYSLQFYKDFAANMSVAGIPADINFKQRGYLFLVGEKGAKQLEANHKLQLKQGVRAQLLDRSGLESHFPSLALSDIVLGCFSPEDGTLTTSLALQGFRRKAESLGVAYVKARVTGFELHNAQLQSIYLDDGSQIQAEKFVCAAGAWSKKILSMINIPLPVVPMCRVKHLWTCAAEIEPLPLIKDESGLFFRPFETGFMGGRPSWDIKPGFAFDSQNAEIRHYFDDYFARVVCPLLSLRLPAFSDVKCRHTWVGHYAQNMLDGNMILGMVGDTVKNLYVASGFSGHGVMHAPAIGLALSELLLTGRFQTFDLSRMSYQRILDDKPYPEKGII